jgi:aldehyde:ferredoxin oxidoreductase
MDRILRVNLNTGTLTDEVPGQGVLRNWLGGTGLGVHYLLTEVGPEITWDHPENRVILAAGPLAGTRVPGSGVLSAVTRGPMTGGACSTQANGFFGAYIKTCGYDGVIVQGIAPDWVYLYVHDGQAELRDASHLLGLDTWEVEDAVKAELGHKQISVFAIGPAGENRVRFAALVGDRGHVAGHNGIGAVLGNKRLKAVAVARGNQPVTVQDPAALAECIQGFKDTVQAAGQTRTIADYGTGGVSAGLEKIGALPVRNLTTNLFPEVTKIDGQYLRSHFQVKPHPCWACTLRYHCHLITVTEGPYAGYVGEEPEYEGLAATGSNIGLAEAGAVVMLSNLVDRLGMDINEAAWVLGWAMECFAKGIFTKANTGGLDLTWGNAEAARDLLLQVANRRGFGALLSDGVKAAAERTGGKAQEIAVYTEKGASPRGHDHRAVWSEMLDTCVSSTGTIQDTGGSPDARQYGYEPITNPFDWQQVARYNAHVSGHRQFQDTVGVCRFTVDGMGLMVQALEAATGLHLTTEEGLQVGKRIVNALRVFNLRCGITRAVERPSFRYGSIPVDGPARGADIAAVWEQMVSLYYETMGWDQTGRPLPETLAGLGLEAMIQR